jgi:hypothetical protein
MAIMIHGVWVYPENLRLGLVFRKLLGKGKEYAIRRETDRKEYAIRRETDKRHYEKAE